MLRNSDRNVKLRSILIVIILATLPCYLLGMIVLWIGNTIKNQPTVTPTLAITITVSPWEGTPTNTLPPIPTSPEFPTLTPTITETPTLTATFFIPSNTPTLSPTPTETPTETVTPTPDLTLTTAPVETSETP